MIFWTLLTCIVVLLVRMDPSKSSRLTGKLYGLVIVIPFDLLEVLSLFRNFFVYIKDDAEEKMNWMTVVLVTSIISVFTVVIAVNDLIDMFTSDSMEINKKEQVFVCDDIHMKVAVPAGYSDITYENADGEIRSVLETHFDRFVVADKAYFKGGFLAEPEMMP